jgi:hypothetical protein
VVVEHAMRVMHGMHGMYAVPHVGSMPCLTCGYCARSARAPRRRLRNGNIVAYMNEQAEITTVVTAFSYTTNRLTPRVKRPQTTS